MKPSNSERLAAVVTAVATPCVIVAVAVLLFLNPIWVGFDQGRSDVTALTGYTQEEVQRVTGSILSDLVFGPPNFDVAVAREPVLDQRERNHMRDVRMVIDGLGAVALIAAVLLAGAGLASRGRRWFWHAAATGASVLVGAVIVVGLAFTVFFDQAFGLFHEVFFPPGTYSFDPRTEKLVQLFPDQFWSETSVALAAVILILSVGVALGARQLVSVEARANAAQSNQAGAAKAAP